MSRALLRVRRGQTGGIVTAVRRPGGDAREGSWSGALLRVRRDGRGIWKHEGQDAERKTGRQGKPRRNALRRSLNGARRQEDREAQAKRIAAQPKRGTKTG